MRPLLTIATVCLNAKNELRGTLENIHSQTYKGFEHIVIDGGSTDGTVDVIKEYAGKIARFVSEPDRGIADAFNKAARLAEGRTMLLLNAGDRFIDSHVLEKVAPLLSAIDDLDSVVAYGDYLLDWKGTMRPMTADATLLPSQHAMCHQASFIGRNIFTTLEYDLRLPTAMDYDLWLRIHGHFNFVHLHVPICIYTWGGVSCLPGRTTPNTIEVLVVQLLNRKVKPSIGVLFETVRKIWVRDAKEKVRNAIGETRFVRLKQMFGQPAR